MQPHGCLETNWSIFILWWNNRLVTLLSLGEKLLKSLYVLKYLQGPTGCWSRPHPSRPHLRCFFWDLVRESVSLWATYVGIIFFCMLQWWFKPPSLPPSPSDSHCNKLWSFTVCLLFQIHFVGKIARLREEGKERQRGWSVKRSTCSF